MRATCFRTGWNPGLPAYHFSARKADGSAMLSVKAVPVSSVAAHPSVPAVSRWIRQGNG